MKETIFFEKLDNYVDFLLDQVLIECIGYDKYDEDEISREVELGKVAADKVADVIQPGYDKDTMYVIPTRRAPVAAEL